jgi:ankyrin repeat protein
MYDGHLEVARLLMENGANVDAKDSDGRTVFQIAQHVCLASEKYKW